jgi:hypothetical protein
MHARCIPWTSSLPIRLRALQRYNLLRILPYANTLNSWRPSKTKTLGAGEVVKSQTAVSDIPLSHSLTYATHGFGAYIYDDKQPSWYETLAKHGYEAPIPEKGSKARVGPPWNSTRSSSQLIQFWIDPATSAPATSRFSTSRVLGSQWAPISAHSTIYISWLNTDEVSASSTCTVVSKNGRVHWSFCLLLFQKKKT